MAASFSSTCPWKPSASAIWRSRRRPAGWSGLEPGQPAYRLLVVDDSEVNRKLLVKIFQPLGFEVREAGDGVEALAAWEEWEPHLIWLDMRMPVMDGYETTRRIKATTRGMATVIIALTASALEEDKAVILSEGCDDYMRKPFHEEDLFDMIAKHLGVRYVYEDIGPAAAPPGSAGLEPGLAGDDQSLAARLAAADPAWLDRAGTCRHPGRHGGHRPAGRPDRLPRPRPGRRDHPPVQALRTRAYPGGDP